MTDDAAIADIILATLAARGPDKSICPSEAAQALHPQEWRSHLSRIRKVAVTLAQAGRIDILRKGRRVDPEAVKGVIRLRLAQEKN